MTTIVGQHAQVNEAAPVTRRSSWNLHDSHLCPNFLFMLTRRPLHSDTDITFTLSRTHIHTRRVSHSQRGVGGGGGGV